MVVVWDESMGVPQSIIDAYDRGELPELKWTIEAHFERLAKQSRPLNPSKNPKGHSDPSGNDTSSNDFLDAFGD
jgi:hypothetical protein